MRTLGLALASLLLLAPAAAGQRVDHLPPERFSVGVYTGVRVPFTTGIVDIRDADGQSIGALQEQRGGNPVLGVEGKVRVAGPVSLVLGGTYSQSGTGEFFIDRRPGFQERGDFGVRYETQSWFAKAGLAARFGGGQRVEDGRALPSTEITVAPALVRELDTNHPALNLGFQGSFPLGGQAAAVTLGIEDYMVFWDADELAPTYLGIANPTFSDNAADAAVLFRTSHLPVIRLGAALRF